LRLISSFQRKEKWLSGSCRRVVCQRKEDEAFGGSRCLNDVFLRLARMGCLDDRKSSGMNNSKIIILCPNTERCTSYRTGDMIFVATKSYVIDSIACSYVRGKSNVFLVTYELQETPRLHDNVLDQATYIHKFNGAHTAAFVIYPARVLYQI
jgi:hypothetical protein